MSHKKTILVTGCAGFIGGNFVKTIGKEMPEIAIVGIDDFSTGRRDALPKGITFYEGSILDDALLEKLFKKHSPEFVFHFAALPKVSYSVDHPTETTEVNVLGTVKLLEKSRDHKVKRFIFSSSASVYGDAKKMPIKESECFPDPQSPYAVQKYACEPLCKIFSKIYNLDTVCLRYFNVYGPNQYGDSPYSTIISSWLEKMYFPDGKKPFLEGSGKQTRDFCFVGNVISANILAMKSKKKLNGEVFNIGDGKRVNMITIKKLIEKYSGKKLVLEKRPTRKGDIKNSHADINQAKKWLKYTPITNLEKGISLTIKWFENRKV
jgi:UDP-glucose 4-epimerase